MSYIKPSAKERAKSLVKETYRLKGTVNMESRQKLCQVLAFSPFKLYMWVRGEKGRPNFNSQRRGGSNLSLILAEIHTILNREDQTFLFYLRTGHGTNRLRKDTWTTNSRDGDSNLDISDYKRPPLRYHWLFILTATVYNDNNYNDDVDNDDEDEEENKRRY